MAKKKEVEVVEERKFAAPTIKALDVIIAPIVTEKSMKLQQEENKVTVKVAPKANKTEIKIAFESIFNVKVVGVNIVNVRAKSKRVGRYEGKVSGYKKAIITLSPEENLNVLAQEAANEQQFILYKINIGEKIICQLEVISQRLQVVAI